MLIQEQKLHIIFSMHICHKYGPSDSKWRPPKKLPISGGASSQQLWRNIQMKTTK
jgi:hypothetical protein